MPKFTVFILAETVHGLDTTLHAARIAPDILVIHDGDAAIERLCFLNRARCMPRIPGVTLGAHVMDAFHDWLLLLQPGELLNPETISAIESWKRRKRDDCGGYLIRCDESDRPQLRFVNRTVVNWVGDFPPVPTNAGIFPGAIVRSIALRAA